MDIQLSSSQETWILGWFGTCSDTEIPFDFTPYKDKIAGIYQVNEFSNSFKQYNPTAPFFVTQPFTALQRGYTYWIIFKVDSDEEVITIPGLITPKYYGTNDPGEGYGKLISGCTTTTPIPPTDVTLSSSQETWILGWFGTCSDTEIPFDFTPYKDKIAGIYQVNEFSNSFKQYNPTAPFFVTQPFTALQRGYTYWIIFKVDSDEEVITIPGLITPKYYGTNVDPGEGYGRITDSCDSGPPGPTACIASATLKNSNSVVEIVIDWNEVTNDGSQSGSVKGLEVVFDNIIFQQGATTSGSAGKPVVTADWGGLSNAEIDNFKNTTGAFRDVMIRDNGSLPTQQITGFAMISLGLPGLTLFNYQNQSGSTWTFEVPVASVLSGTEPIIAETRVYDSSDGILKYGITEC